MSADLHSRIRTELDRRLAIARAAVGHQLFDGTGIVQMSPHNSPRVTVVLPSHVATFSVIHSPSDAILRYTRDLAVLERHRDCQNGVLHGHDPLHWCDICWTPHPCPEADALAESLGLPIETTPKG